MHSNYPKFPTKQKKIFERVLKNNKNINAEIEDTTRS